MSQNDKSNDHGMDIHENRKDGGQKRNLDNEALQCGLPSHKRQRTSNKDIMTVDLTQKQDDDNEIQSSNIHRNMAPQVVQFFQNNSDVVSQISHLQVKKPS